METEFWAEGTPSAFGLVGGRPRKPHQEGHLRNPGGLGALGSSCGGSFLCLGHALGASRPHPGSGKAVELWKRARECFGPCASAWPLQLPQEGLELGHRP